MRNEYEYLSDIELESLIKEVGEKDLVFTPPDFEEAVIKALEAKKRKAYRRYCIQVVFSVAAAIIVLCLMPFNSHEHAEIPSRDTVLAETRIKTREEILNQKTVSDNIEDRLADLWNKIGG